MNIILESVSRKLQQMFTRVFTSVTTNYVWEVQVFFYKYVSLMRLRYAAL